MGKAKHRHSVWVVTTRNFENGMSETEFSPRMGYVEEEAYMKAHGLKDREKKKMPLKYDPDTGIPSYVPDLGEELEEGVTPKPTTITSKSEVFKGDKPLTQEQYEKLRDGGIPVHSEMGSDEADKLLADALRSARSARPARLDKDVATDEEMDELERLARAGTVMHWPTLLRLINRLRRAEAK